MLKLLRDFSPSLDEIQELEKNASVKLVHKGVLNGRPAFLTKRLGKGFQIEIEDLPDCDNIDVGDELRFQIESKPALHITSSYCKEIYLNSSNRPNRKYTIYVRAFENNVNIKRKYYCRTILSIKDSLPFNYMIDSFGYSHSRGTSLGLIQVSLADLNDYKIYSYSKENNHYLIIDSEFRKTPGNFREECWSTLVSLGFVQGYLPQDEEYIFYYTSKKNTIPAGFEYRILRDTLKSIYKPIHSNPYSWRSIPKPKAKEYHKIVRNLNNMEFSSLCKWVHSEKDIKAILLLILEATNASLLCMPASLSVALEGLTEYFYERNRSILQPISHRKTSRKIIQDLKNVLSNYHTHPDIKSYDTLLSKIEQLNAPTNAEKLKTPFTVLDIELSDIDKESINYRNDFLHGNINLKPRKGKKAYSMDSFEIALRLLTLINAVILKNIGFNSFILNHSKLHRARAGQDINEGYYRSLCSAK